MAREFAKKLAGALRAAADVIERSDAKVLSSAFRIGSDPRIEVRLLSRSGETVLTCGDCRSLKRGQAPGIGYCDAAQSVYCHLVRHDTDKACETYRRLE